MMMMMNTIQSFTMMMMKYFRLFLLHRIGKGISCCLFVVVLITMSFLFSGMIMMNKTTIGGILPPFNTKPLSMKTTTTMMMMSDDTTTIIEKVAVAASSSVQDFSSSSLWNNNVEQEEEEQEANNKEELKHMLNSEEGNTISASLTSSSTTTLFTDDFFLVNYLKILKRFFFVVDDDDDDDDSSATPKVTKTDYGIRMNSWEEEEENVREQNYNNNDIDTIHKDDVSSSKIVHSATHPTSKNIKDGDQKKENNRHQPKNAGIFRSLFNKLIQKGMKLFNTMKMNFTELIESHNKVHDVNNENGDSSELYSKLVESKYNKEDSSYNKLNNKEEEEDHDEDNKSGGSYLRSSVSSNLGQSHDTNPSKNDQENQDLVYDIITSSLHNNPSFKTQDIMVTNNYQAERIEYTVAPPLDRIKSNRLLLQTRDGVSSSPICSNISDTFTTTYVIIYAGNQSLVTDEKTNILAITFATSYNDGRIGNTNSAGNNKCDPLFRTITQVQVTTNASFTGANNGEVVGNPLPMIPVRKLQQESSSSALMDGISWESILEFHQVNSHNKDWIHRQLQFQQQQQQQQQQQSQSNNNNTFSNNTFRPQTGNFGFGLLLLDIVGTCRGCQGGSGSVGISLFDDITTTSTRARQLEEDGINNSTNSTTDCICPADAALADSNSFQETFQSQIEELRDNGELDFLEQIDEVIPVRGTECPTKDQDFSTVYLVSGMVFSRTLLLNLGVKGVQEVEKYFRDSYNGVAQQLCDPFYRAISKNQLVSIIETEDEEEGSTRTVQLEFVIEATCRGDNCIDSGCIFDEANSCDTQKSRHRELTLQTANIDHSSSLFSLPNDDHDAILRPVDESMTGIHNILRRPSRFLQKDDKKNDDDDEEERCFCRKGRSIRPPTEHEFKMAFQAGLDQITEKNKLSSCLECSFPTDCKSGVCLAGRCAEADTGLLLNSCSCSNNEECESKFCQEDPSTGLNDLPVSGTCQGKLPSCRACNNGDECLSGFCTDERCAEASDGKLKNGCACTSNVNCQTGRCVDDFTIVGVLGECMQKIINTCTEPCFSPNDCESGKCGSVVCMPLDGTLLPDGCFSTMSSECGGGMSENNRCTTAATTSQFPSFQPSLQPNTPPTNETTPIPTFATTPGPTFEPSPQPSTQPSLSPSLSPSAGPTMLPSVSPSVAPSMSPSISPSVAPSILPSISPSVAPSMLPSVAPTMSPTFSPSDAPSTPLPSISPSSSPTTLPTSTPSTSPTTSPPSSPPSSTPSTSFPSKFPTSPPSQSPSATPSASPSASPSGLEDCRTFSLRNADTMSEVYSFCRAHRNEECCSGDQACGGWNLQSTYKICKNSCRGLNACQGLTGDSLGRAIIHVGIGSCLGESSCQGISFNSENAEDDIKPSYSLIRGSCNGVRACQNIKAQNVIVNYSSCIDVDACSGIGRGDTKSVSIGSPVSANAFFGGACLGESSCSGIYLDSPSKGGAIKIEGGACREQSACKSFGARTGGDVTIKLDSCRGQEACSSFGYDVAGNIIVNSNSCMGELACSNFSTAASSIVIGGSACTVYGPNGDYIASQEKSCFQCGSNGPGTGTGPGDKCSATGAVDIGVGTATCPLGTSSCPRA